MADSSTKWLYINLHTKTSSSTLLSCPTKIHAARKKAWDATLLEVEAKAEYYATFGDGKSIQNQTLSLITLTWIWPWNLDGETLLLFSWRNYFLSPYWQPLLRAARVGLPAIASGFSWTLVHYIRYAMHNQITAMTWNGPLCVTYVMLCTTPYQPWTKWTLVSL